MALCLWDGVFKWGLSHVATNCMKGFGVLLLWRVLEFGGRVTACLLVSYSVDSLYQISVLLWLSTTVIALNEERLSYIVHHYSRVVPFLPCRYMTHSKADSLNRSGCYLINNLYRGNLLYTEQHFRRSSLKMANRFFPSEKVLLPFLPSFFSPECFNRSFLDWKVLLTRTFSISLMLNHCEHLLGAIVMNGLFLEQKCVH